MRGNEWSNSMALYTKVRQKIKVTNEKLQEWFVISAAQMTHPTERLLKISLQTPAGPADPFGPNAQIPAYPRDAVWCSVHDQKYVDSEHSSLLLMASPFSASSRRLALMLGGFEELVIQECHFRPEAGSLMITNVTMIKSETHERRSWGGGELQRNLQMCRNSLNSTAY